MLAIFCFYTRGDEPGTDTALGNITVHQHSSEYDQLLAAGYSFRLFEHDQARNYVGSMADLEALADQYQPEIHYHQGLPVKLDHRGVPTFGGLAVGTPRPWTDEFIDEDRDPSGGW